jgi:GNAT superfamily N-acetyltransferase
MQWHRDGYTLDDDRTRLDMPRIVEWVQNSYWAKGRPIEVVLRSWEHAAVVMGLYHGNEQVGGARVVTDLATAAYLADVFLLPEHRGRGLGLWLVETLVTHPALAGCRWLLHTRDAHALYARVGFQPAGERVMERPRPAPGAG